MSKEDRLASLEVDELEEAFSNVQTSISILRFFKDWIMDLSEEFEISQSAVIERAILFSLIEDNIEEFREEWLKPVD